MNGFTKITTASLIALGLMSSFGTASLADDVSEGEAVFEENCNACHKFGRANNFGPNLIGVVGRQPGTYPGYRYTNAMKAFGQDKVWTEDTLFEYIELPRRMVLGTKMSFPGLKDADKRRKVIAYLKAMTLRSAAIVVE